jgi:hypothetical protein
MEQPGAPRTPGAEDQQLPEHTARSGADDIVASTPAGQQPEQAGAGDEKQDDSCLICYQILYRPAKTECEHTACESCLLRWALDSMRGTTPADVSHLTSKLAIDGIKFTCPSCRTYTEAPLDPERDAFLQDRYPEEYGQRRLEIRGPDHTDPEPNAADTQEMTLMIGNCHRIVPYSISPYTGVMRNHEWTFFVMTSRPDVIDHVQVLLHPTFREDRHVTLTEVPFSTTHKGWGWFEILAAVQLKEGWRWIHGPEAEAVDSDASAGRLKDTLLVRWTLDFQRKGSQTNQVAEFRRLNELDREAIEAREHAFNLSELADALVEV